MAAFLQQLVQNPIISLLYENVKRKPNKILFHFCESAL